MALGVLLYGTKPAVTELLSQASRSGSWVVPQVFLDEATGPKIIREMATASKARFMVGVNGFAKLPLEESDLLHIAVGEGNFIGVFDIKFTRQTPTDRRLAAVNAAGSFRRSAPGAGRPLNSPAQVIPRPKGKKGEEGRKEPEPENEEVETS